MNCPSCGKNNDSDAQFCEYCGRFLEIRAEKGLSHTTKIFLIFIVILIIGLGITAGIVLKNTQTSQSSISKQEISEASGFPVSEVPSLAMEISKNNDNMESITYGSVTLDSNQCIYIFARAIVMIDSGQDGNIPIKSLGNAPNPQGNIVNTNIVKSQYIDMASRMYIWMDNYGQTPNFIGINTPGQPDLSPQTTLKLFAKVLSEYKSTGQLPTAITI